MSYLGGNKAVKITSEQFSEREENALFSREGFIYYNLLNLCDSQVTNLAKTKNIDLLEYNALFSARCGKYEKLYFDALRTKMRQKLYDDQIREINGNYENIYNPYNPYLGKYNGSYLRTYQKF